MRPVGQQEGDFFGTVNPKRAADYGQKIVEFSIPEGLFHNLWNRNLIKQSGDESFYITPQAQELINAVL